MKLRKITKTWWVDFRANGVRIRRNTKTEDRKTALEFMRSIEAAKRAPTFEMAVEILKMIYRRPVEGRIATADIWPTYERVARSVGKDAISQRSWERRRLTVEKFVRWLKKARPEVSTAEAVTGIVAAAYAEHLANGGRKTKTRKNVIAELGTVWKLLEKASADIRNPWQNLTPRVTDSERMFAFTPEQERAVLKAAKEAGKDWYPICVLMRQTGLRYSDVARLKWSDIRDGIISTTPHKTAAHGISVAIPLTAPAREAIATLRREGEDYLFPLHAELYGRRDTSARGALNFRAVLDAAGVKGSRYTIHSWRHTAATRLAESGASADVRKRILGHTTDAMAAHYDHASHLAELRAALDRAV